MTTSTIAVSAKSLAATYLLIEQGKKGIKDGVENVWVQLVTFCKPAMPNDGNPEALLAYLTQTVETEIRLQMGGKGSMPGAYRSAKSVISKAIQKGVPMFNDDGTVRGKTAIEKDCKEVMTPEERVVHHLQAIRKLLDNGAAINGDARALLSSLI